MESEYAVNEKGYARIRRGDTRWYHHRWEYHTKVRPLRENEVVRHRCDNPRCINIDHLEAGSTSDNSIDRSMRGPRGSKLRLTPDQVLEIKSVLRNQTTYRQIAERYGVSVSCIKQIGAGNTWSHLKEEPDES